MASGDGRPALSPDLGRDGAASVDGGRAAEGPNEELGPLQTLVRMEDARRFSRPVFERYLRDPDVAVRRRAALALARIASPAGLGPLRSTLSDTDSQARGNVLFALGQIEGPARRDAERILVAFLELSPPPPDRIAAVKALGYVGSPESVPMLAEALESPEPRLRSAGARGLGFVTYRHPRLWAQIGPAVIQRLDDSSSEARLAAAFALSRTTELPTDLVPAATAALERLLRGDADPEVRVMAGRALGRLGGGRPGVALAALEHDSDYRVRVTAAMALKSVESSRPLARALSLVWSRLSSDPDLLSSRDLHLLMTLLDVAAERSGGAVAAPLRRIENESGRLLASTSNSTVRRALQHVRCSAASALDRSRHRPRRVLACWSEDNAPGLMEPWQHRVYTVQVFLGSQRPRTGRQLRDYLLEDDDERVRLAALQAVSGLPGRAGLSLLERALADQSGHVVAAAANKIAARAEEYRPPDEAPERLSIVEHTDQGPIAHTLESGQAPRRQVPATTLTKAFARFEPQAHLETTLNLMRAVRELEVDEAADVVLPLCGHHNRTIRAQARRTLEALGRDPGVELGREPPNIVDLRELENGGREVVGITVTTSRGQFVIELRPDVAPATVARFLRLAREGYYDGVYFHRVAPAFVIQSGDPSGTGYGGPSSTLRCELNQLPYERGSVGMALAGRDTGGSQFFIAYSAQPHLSRRYTLFGRVVEGLDVVDRLQAWDRILSLALVDVGTDSTQTTQPPPQTR